MPTEKVEATFSGEKFSIHIATSASPKLGRRVYITAGDDHSSFETSQIALDAESAYRLAVALFGMSENFDKPITESSEDRDFLDGDLVIIHGVAGEYESGSCLIWDDHRRKNPKLGYRYVARSPGTGIHLYPESQMTLHRPRLSSWRGYDAPLRADLIR